MKRNETRHLDRRSIVLLSALYSIRVAPAKKRDCPCNISFLHSLVSGPRPSPRRVPSGKERGLLFRTAAGD